MEVNDPTVTAHVGMGAIGNGGLGLAVELHLTLPGLSREDAEKLAETAHKVCPYSNATRGNIEVQIIIEEPTA
jgi:organic hydroperoxide reductase OsmC/OhrA